MKNILLLLLFCGVGLQNIYAQHIDIDKKVLSFLKETDSINTIFSYKNLTFNPDFLSEEAYVKHQIKKIEKNKSSEIAEDWNQKFHIAKEKNWPSNFYNTLNAKLSEYKNGPTFIKNRTDLKYTMEISTEWIYPGYSVIVGKEPAKINLKISFYETSKPENIIYTTFIKRAMGFNNETYNLRDWPNLRRVSKAYKKAAYKLAQALKRVVD